MTRRLSTSRLPLFGALAVLNVCVALMFVVILAPSPELPVIVVASTPRTQKVLIPEAKPVVGTAKRIVVPSVGIDSTVREGSYDSDSHSWSIDTKSAFYATMTVPVNNTNGSTLIYGHAGWGIFDTLPKVKKGAKATVYTKEGYKFVYVFESNRQVEPTDVSALTDTGSPKLILQTCSGAFDTYRTLVTFRLKEVRDD